MLCHTDIMCPFAAFKGHPSVERSCTDMMCRLQYLLMGCPEGHDSRANLEMGQIEGYVIDDRPSQDRCPHLSKGHPTEQNCAWTVGKGRAEMLILSQHKCYGRSHSLCSGLFPTSSWVEKLNLILNLLSLPHLDIFPPVVGHDITNRILIGNHRTDMMCH